MSDTTASDIPVWTVSYSDSNGLPQTNYYLNQNDADDFAQATPNSTEGSAFGYTIGNPYSQDVSQIYILSPSESVPLSGSQLNQPRPY